MAKKNVMITLDEDLHKKAKERFMNISQETEKAIRAKFVESIKDLPEDSLIVKCSQCSKEIEEGFVCLEREMVLCNKCQETFRMDRCPHNNFNEHMHIKWTRIQNQDIIKKYKKQKKS